MIASFWVGGEATTPNGVPKLNILHWRQELKWINLVVSADCASDVRDKKPTESEILSTIKAPVVFTAFLKAEQDDTPVLPRPYNRKLIFFF